MHRRGRVVSREDLGVCKKNIAAFLPEASDKRLCYLWDIGCDDAGKKAHGCSYIERLVCLTLAIEVQSFLICKISICIWHQVAPL
jgi:hypothetical protein